MIHGIHRLQKLQANKDRLTGEAEEIIRRKSVTRRI
jgi:hypothetical protein